MPVVSLKSLEKAIDLMMLFSEHRPTLSLRQISSGLQLPESTVYRILRTLEKKHVIARDPFFRKYTLNASLLRLGTVISSHLNIGRLTKPHLEDLASRSGETAHLHLLQNHQMVLIEVVSSPNIVRFSLDKGSIMPLHAPAGGRAILAFLSDEFFDEYVQLYGLQQFTPYTVTDVQELRRLLSEVRSRGFAITTQQTVLAATAVAAPVFNHRQEAIASIAVVGPSARFTEQDALSLAPFLRTRAADLSRELGASEAPPRRSKSMLKPS